MADLDPDTSRLPFGSLIDRIRGNADDDFDPSYGDTNDEESNREAIFMIGMTVFFLVLLVICKYGCIWFIDAVILCEFRRSWRNNSNESFLKRALFSCCPRIFPPNSSDGDLPNSDGRNSNNSDVVDDATATNTSDSDTSDDGGMELMEQNANYAKRVVRILTEEQKRSLFASVLHIRTATEADTGTGGQHLLADTLQEREETQMAPTTDEENQKTTAESIVVPDGSASATNSDDACCPICIQDIKLGDRVCQCKHCHHVFHADCIVGWLGTGSTLCPYCRCELYTRSMLEEAYRRQQEQERPKKQKKHRNV